MTLQTREEKLGIALAASLRTMQRNPGNRMPNGTTVLVQSDGIRESDYGNRYIVLALDPSGTYQPFVTWRRLVGVQQLATGGFGPLEYVTAGHYFRSLEDALADFNERVERDEPDA